MKKRITIHAILFAVIAMFYVNSVNAQIADLDVSKYYMIINHGVGDEPATRGGVGRNAMSIDSDHFFEDGALLEQQTPDELQPNQLWKIVPITDSTYYFINKGTEMALGVSDWRGDNPFWTGSATPDDAEKISLLSVPGFNWSGSHRAVVQREFSEGEETQIWQPTEFPTNSTSGDTTFYRMTLAMHLVDSGLCFNIWEQWTFDGFTNICLFPGVKESSKYNDAGKLYGYWFKKTDQDVPDNSASINELEKENITVFSRDGAIILGGEMYGKTVEIYTSIGQKIYSAKVNTSELNIPIKQGIYIVKVDRFTTKLLVQ